SYLQTLVSEALQLLEVYLLIVDEEFFSIAPESKGHGFANAICQFLYRFRIIRRKSCSSKVDFLVKSRVPDNKRYGPFDTINHPFGIKAFCQRFNIVISHYGERRNKGIPPVNLYYRWFRYAQCLKIYKNACVWRNNLFNGAF